MSRPLLCAASCIFTLVSLGGCESHTPVPETECDQVVKHARKLLGDSADSWRKMEKQCKSASDQDRGCVMVADSPADIARCSM